MILNMIVKRKLIQIGEEEIICRIMGNLKIFGYCALNMLVIMLMISRGVI